MNLYLSRMGYGRDSTLGRISLGSLSFFSLEDERRDVKVPGYTCIPVGSYEIKLRKAGGLHKKYKARFPDLHKGMLWLQDVPGFEWVYIHIGNDADDTAGCPLVGELPVILPTGEFEIGRSTPAYVALYRKVIAALEAGDRVWVHIREL